MNDKTKNLIWQEKSKKELLKTVVVDIMQTTSISPDGTEGNYIVMDANDWVITIPVIDDCFLMVEQWRHGEKNLSIEFPGGVIDSGEKKEVAAMRELKEETGFIAKKLIHLGSVNPNPALMSNHVHIFAAFDLVQEGNQDLDSDEYVNFLKIPKQEVFQNFGTEKFQHALMGTAIALFLQHNFK